MKSPDLQILILKSPDLQTPWAFLLHVTSDWGWRGWCSCNTVPPRCVWCWGSSRAVLSADWSRAGASSALLKWTQRQRKENVTFIRRKKERKEWMRTWGGVVYIWSGSGLFSRRSWWWESGRPHHSSGKTSVHALICLPVNHHKENSSISGCIWLRASRYFPGGSQGVCLLLELIFLLSCHKNFLPRFFFSLWHILKNILQQPAADANKWVWLTFRGQWT